jgi:hypothetical protein
MVIANDDWDLLTTSEQRHWNPRKGRMPVFRYNMIPVSSDPSPPVPLRIIAEVEEEEELPLEGGKEIPQDPIEGAFTPEDSSAFS